MVNYGLRSVTDLTDKFRAKKNLWRWATVVLRYSAILCLAFVFTIPFLFAVSTSFKVPAEIMKIPPIWIPSSIQWRNYIDVWVQAPFSLFIRNTVIVTLLSMLGQVFSAAMVAYGFARFRFPGRDLLFVVLLGTMILPIEVTIIPTFLLFKSLGWLDSWKPLIVPYYFGGGAFAIFLFRQFFMTIPRDLDEAATIDGASSFRIFWSIILPLSKPVTATLVIFSFIWHWNSFLEPLIYLDTTEKFVISLGLRFFQHVAMTGGPANEHLYMAAALITSLPCIVVFLIMQRHFIRGIVMTGLKL